MAGRRALSGMADSRRFMRWQLKARLQNAVAALPFASDAVYYAIQRTAGGLRRGRNHPVERFAAAVRMAEWIESAGSNIPGKRFVEVGTGHMVNLPTAFWLLGAGETITVDLNRYLSEKLVKESNQYVRENEQLILNLFGDRSASRTFKDRFAQLVVFRGGLDDLLAMMNVRYFSPSDARALPIGDNSIDFHVSNTVLEHIAPDSLSEILAEAKRVLRRGGLLVHHIDPSDHFSHSDDSIAAINFLKFSEGDWRRWAGNRFMYHNRLRARDFISLFEGAGARILRSEKHVDERSLMELKNGFALAKEFESVPPDDLATTELSLMATFDPCE
jgi:SAM-dependent methyltransferase